MFSLADGHWTESGAPIALGHLKGINPKDKIYAGGNGLGVPPQAAGLAISQDGKTIAVADFENDSLSLVDLTSQQVTDVPLRPGIINPKLGDAVGGEYPFEVTIKGNDTAYVTSLWDREVDVVTLRGTPRVTARIKLHGNPNSLRLDASAKTLFVTCDNSDDVAMTDTGTNSVTHVVRTIAPADILADAEHYRGAAQIIWLSPRMVKRFMSPMAARIASQ